jgi:hypothetical protein
MDIKQLVTSNPKAGFYPVTQDTITVIELNKAVMSLTNESSSEDIIAAFDNLESFQALIAEVRNPQNICSGILVNETPEDRQVGKCEASIIANTDTETLYIRWIEIDKIVTLAINNTDGTMSCIRIENNVGGRSGENDIYVWTLPRAGESITSEEYNAISEIIESNKIILFNVDILNVLPVYYMEYKDKENPNNDYIYIVMNFSNQCNAIKIRKDTFAIETETLNFVQEKDVLTKINTIPFTPNTDYQPATKKYVDDFMNVYQVESEIAASYDLTTGYVDGISMNELAYNSIKANIIRVSIIDQDNKKCGDIIIDKTKNSIIYSCGYVKVKTKDKIYGCNVESYISNNVLYANFAIKECYLKESEYSKYGEVVNTDNILYFVTPDA